jgi:hypothetical protein
MNKLAVLTLFLVASVLFLSSEPAQAYKLREWVYWESGKKQNTEASARELVPVSPRVSAEQVLDTVELKSKPLRTARF